MLATLNGEPEVKKVKFMPFEENGRTSPELDFELLNNLKAHMTVELANASMTLREVLGLNEGNIIGLEKIAGEPVDIRVDGEVFAKGEVVIINEVFGIRVGSLISNNEE